jgi:hypothetical protein
VTDDQDVLTAEENAALRARFDAGQACQHCGGLHARACPRVRELSFHPNGVIAQVRFWADGEWSDAAIIWPEELDPEAG